MTGERDELNLKLQDALSRASTLPTRSANIEDDDLVEIIGVGPVYATKLGAAGFRKYADVANSTAEALADAVMAPAWRTPNFEEWITHAKQLAGMV